MCAGDARARGSAARRRGVRVHAELRRVRLHVARHGEARRSVGAHQQQPAPPPAAALHPSG